MQEEEYHQALDNLTDELVVIIPSLVSLPPDQLVDEFRMAVTTLADDATVWTLNFYDELAPERPFISTPFVDSSLEARVSANARFAITQDNTASFLEGSGTRAVNDQARSTLIKNVENEGGKWYRIPSADACGFCRLLATRGPVYKTAHTAAASHDKCKCRVAVQRPGMSYEKPSYMSSWNDDYKRHRSAVIAEGGTVSGKEGRNNIVNAWNRELYATGIRTRTPGVDTDTRFVA